MPGKSRPRCAVQQLLDARQARSHSAHTIDPCRELRIQSLKQAAEAVLRELPSVLGACVREDVFGHPREIHLLVRAGPNPRHLAYDVRDLLEERLGIPVDQRVISIAQLAPGKEPGPRLSAANEAGSVSAATAAAEAGAMEEIAAATPLEPRVRFTGVSTETVDGRARVSVRLELDDVTLRNESVGVDSPAGRTRAAASAALTAINETCIGRARFEVEHTTRIDAMQRQYVLVSVLVSSPFLGRRPIPLIGAHPVELDDESAAVLAALKAINRTLSLVLRLSDGSTGRSAVRSRV